MTETHLPIVCELSAEALAARRTSLAAGVLTTALDVEEIENGLRWRFASRQGLLPELSALIEAERTCCRFLSFHVHADASNAPVTLEVTGPPGTRAFLLT